MLWQAAGAAGEEVSRVTWWPLHCAAGRHLLLTGTAEAVSAHKEQGWSASASSSLVSLLLTCREIPERFFCFKFLNVWQTVPPSSKLPGAFVLLQVRGVQLPSTVRSPSTLAALCPCSTGIHSSRERSLASVTTSCLLQHPLAFFKCHFSTWPLPTLWTRTYWQKCLFSSHLSPWRLYSTIRSWQYHLRSEMGFCPTWCHGLFHVPIILVPKVL